MSVTFDPTLPTDRDRLRIFLAQTESSSPLADETLDALIAQQPTINLAAATAATFLAGFYAQKLLESTAAEVKVKYGDRAEYYRKLAEQLRTGTLSVDGISPAGFSVGEMAEPDLTEYRTK